MQQNTPISERTGTRKIMESANNHRHMSQKEPAASSRTDQEGDIEAIPGIQAPSGPTEEAGVAAAAAVTSPEECLQEQNVAQNMGLSFREVESRRQEAGRNEFEEDEVEPMSQKFLEQFKDPMISLLLVSAGISVLMGQWDDAFSITLAIVLVSTVAVVQEYKSDQTLAALGQLAPPKCIVRREGRVEQVVAGDLVPGDIVLLRVGDRVPADLRLLDCFHLTVDESSLTGEPEPAEKHSRTLPKQNGGHSLADRSNIAYMGTLIRTGRGEGIAMGTAHCTELGRMYDIVSKEKNRKSPLQIRMDALGKQLSTVSIVLIVLIVLIGAFQKRDLLKMFTIGVSLAVAAIPEGLPIVVTVTLALGVQRMAARKAVVKKLTAVETLGCANVVCADKTGTLTKNEMTAVEVYTVGSTSTKRKQKPEARGNTITLTGLGYNVDGGTAQMDDLIIDTSTHPSACIPFEIGAVCNDAQLAGGGADEFYETEDSVDYNPSKRSDTQCALVSGQPTEAALLVAARKVGLPQIRNQYQRTLEIPFSHERKWMAVRVRPRSAAAHSHSQELEPYPISPVLSLNLYGALVPHESDNHSKSLLRSTVDYLSNVGHSDEERENGIAVAEGSAQTGWGAVEGEIYFLKGSLEGLLPLCTSFVNQECSNPSASGSNFVVQMSPEHRQKILSNGKRMAREGLRVLALAVGRKIPSVPTEDGGSAADERSATEPIVQDNDGLVFAGLIGLHDPPREGVKKSIAVLQQSGVRIAMITGDSQETAVAVATHLGLTSDGRNHPDWIEEESSVKTGGKARDRADSSMHQWLSEAEVDVESIGKRGATISGREIDTLTEQQLADRLHQVCVFYRTTPGHKMKIVKAYQSRQDVVAMTGDGVNDAAALKAADIGVSMGEAGTEVAKQASDVVLLDDNFATILTAVEEGKGIFYNIRNFVRFQLSTSVAALALVAFATAFGYPNPLNAMQILWINIIMDGPPAQSLGVEPVSRDVMQLPPRKRDESIISLHLLCRVIVSGLIVVFGTLYVFFKEIGDSEVVSARTTTLTFTAFVLYDMFNALSCRSVDKSVFELGMFSNRFFMWAVGGSLAGQIAVVYFPPLQAIFQTEALSLNDWVYLISVSSSILVYEELFKLIAAKYIEQPDVEGADGCSVGDRPTARAYETSVSVNIGVLSRFVSSLKRMLPRFAPSKDEAKGKPRERVPSGGGDDGHAVTLSSSQRMRSFYQPLARKTDEEDNV
eukprot:gb/GECG01012216.1/.p1 GENE.gb/GECG01012216.1/~~gb/GECG01012216.1/.p1  ORF type:complete len:1233 (+),score=171.41 gb/GECG01012216.1/:1-3699(+)